MTKRCRRCHKFSSHFSECPKEIKLPKSEHHENWGKRICSKCVNLLYELYPKEEQEISPEINVKLTAFDNLTSFLKNDLDQRNRLRRPIWKVMLGTQDPLLFQKAAMISDRTMERIRNTDSTILSELKFPEIHIPKVNFQKNLKNSSPR